MSDLFACVACGCTVYCDGDGRWRHCLEDGTTTEETEAQDQDHVAEPDED